MFRVAVRARGRSLCVSDRDHREKRDYARHGEKKNTKNPELPSISRDGFGCGKFERASAHLERTLYLYRASIFRSAKSEPTS